MDRREMLKGIGAAAVLAAVPAVPKITEAQGFEVIEAKNIHCEKGDQIGVSLHLISPHAVENAEWPPETAILQVNGQELFRRESAWNMPPTPLFFTADDTDLNFLVLCNENSLETKDNFAQLVVTRNGSVAFSRRQKALASRNGLAIAFAGGGVEATVGALSAAGVIGGPLAWGLLAVGGTLLGLGGLLAWIGSDPPDWDYGSEFQPQVMLPGPLPKDTWFQGDARRVCQRVLDAFAPVWAYGYAAYVSANRAQGARETGDLGSPEWQQMMGTTPEGWQMGLCQGYLSRTADQLAIYRQRLRSFRDYWRAHPIYVYGEADRPYNVSIEQIGIDLLGGVGPASQALYGLWDSIGMDGASVNLARNIAMSVMRPANGQGFISMPLGWQPVVLPTIQFPDCLDLAISEEIPALIEEFRVYRD